jgi:hypothetical protein
MSLDIEERLEKYSEIFDYYIETENLHPSVQNDILAQYIQSTLDGDEVKENYLNDLKWRERLKVSLLDFFHILLTEIEEYEKRKKQELSYIESFLNADIKKKRVIWKGMTDYIRKSYSFEEVNIDGYELLFNDSNITKDDIFECIANDWRKAACRRYEKLRAKHTEFNKDCLKKRIKGLRGNKDFKVIGDIEKIIYKYPTLKEIANIMGRKEEGKQSELDSVSNKYVPFLLSHSQIREEVDGVVLGDNLSAMLPSETVLLDSAETDSIFYKKYVTKQLQLAQGKSQIKKIEKNNKIKNQRRLQKGPMIISIDTSSSMSGNPEEISKSILINLLDTAKCEKRKCFLITYSVNARSLEISKPYHWDLVMTFLRKRFTGGTNAEAMLQSVINTLGTQEYSMADVLVISDFGFSYPCEKTHNAITRTKENGTKYYALSIGECIKREEKFMSLFDKVWYV